MSQVSSMAVPNGSGLSVRTGINAVLEALASSSSGGTAPANPLAGQLWFDTATNQLKQRNGTNSAWLVLVFAGRKISADGPGLSGFGDLSADRTAVLNLGALPDKTAAEYAGPHFVVTNGAVAKSQAKMTVAEAKKALSLGGLAGIDLPSSLDPALGLRGDGTWAEDQAAAIASGAAGAPKIKGRALDIAAGLLTGTTALVDLDDAAQILLVGSAAVTGNSESSLIRARVGYQLSSNNGVNWGAEIPLSEVYFASLPRNERAATSGQVLIDMVGYNAIRLNGFGTLTGAVIYTKGV